jgi:anti-sigma regulatory factor (Ser/Thr protein kinase)
VAAPIEAVPDRLVQLLRPGPPDDDIAILIARVSDRSGEDRYAACTLGSDADVVRQAREFTIARLAEWDVPTELGYDLELIVSELVTNAVRHGRPPVELRLRRAVDRLFVDVHDAAAAPPRMRHAGPADDSGRGLLIVATLSERWGTRHTDNGKSVWCRVRLPH